MMICTVHQVSKTFGGNPIFENLTLEVMEKDRVGLVGRNGSGKTTICKLISGQETPDIGEVYLRKGCKVGYLSQIPQVEKGALARDVLFSAFGDLKTMESSLKSLELRMASQENKHILSALLKEYGAMQERFSVLGGYEMDANVSRVATGLQIEALLDQPFSILSGGEKTKVCLGFILLQNPDLLLLDEPTNHLDIDAMEWLAQFLQEYNGAVVVISHDRYFLDEVATKIVDIEDGELTVYHTNYSGFVQEKEEKLLREFQAFKEQERKIKKIREAIKRLREWANQANPPNPKLHRRANSMERALERMEKLKRPILQRKQMSLDFSLKKRSGDDVVVAKGVARVVEDRVLYRQVQLHVQFQERVAIVGKNGTGKSTILKQILGELPVDEGEIRLGSSVRLGYLSQHVIAEDDNRTVLEVFRDVVAVPEGEARHILASFLFYGHAVFKKVNQLSGGERIRLRLAQLMYSQVNLLILDEPTNHLDIESRETLEDALDRFKGTIIAVSHDRYFLNKLFQQTYWLENQHLYHYIGNYDWAREKHVRRREERSQAEKENRPSTTANKRVSVGQSSTQEEYQTKYQVKQTIHWLEQRLEQLEREIYELDQLLALGRGIEEVQQLYSSKAVKEQEREQLYEQLATCIDSTSNDNLV